MFDIGFWELFLVAVIGLIVLGPERLPHAVRMAGAWIGRIRRSILDAQYEITRQLELEELKQRLLKIEQEKDVLIEKDTMAEEDNTNHSAHSQENDETIIRDFENQEIENQNINKTTPSLDVRNDDLDNERFGRQ